MKRFKGHILTGMVIALTAIGCQQKPKEVKIGVVLPMSASGEMSSYARDILNGVYMGFDQTGGKVQDVSIKIIEKDYAGDPAKLESILKELKDQGVVCVIGPVNSTDALAVKSTVNALSLPTFTPSATLNSVIEGSDYLWRVCASDKHMGQAAAHLAGPEMLNLKEVAIIEQGDNPYSDELASNFKGFCDEEGVKVVKVIIRKKGEALCDNAVVKDILTSFNAAQNETGVFVPMYYQDAAQVITDLRKAGYQGVILGGDGWDSAKLPGMVGENSGTNYFITHFYPGEPEAKGFVENYKAKYQESPSAFSALGYDAFMVVHNALAKAQSLSSQGLKEQVPYVSFEGATGTIEFGKGYEPGARRTVVVKLENGKLEFYKSMMLSPYKSSAKITNEGAVDPDAKIKVVEGE